jgi:hypothetical protein
VAGRFADLELMSSEVNSVSLFDLSVGAHHASALGNHGFGTEVLAQQTTAGHVIGVHVCVEYIYQFELQLLDQRSVTIELFDHGVDEHRFARLFISE